MTLIIMALWAVGIALLIAVAVHRGRLPSNHSVSRLAEPPKENASVNPRPVNFDSAWLPGNHLVKVQKYRQAGSFIFKNLDEIMLSGLSEETPKEKPRHSGDKVKNPLTR